ncbi:MAG: exopolysaccharide biosynthesis polyprenyl glycosylphosphotransferase [Clostridia bacterium]|nr:exopolysaccharide biosynthesis polyprenyl glycosylphosphotransferase [Clostridia bacterium]
MCNRMLIRLMKLINILGSAYLFWNAWHFYYSPRFQIGLAGYGEILVLMLYCIIQLLLNRTYNAYDIGSSKTWALFYSLCLADGVGLAIYILIMWIGWADIPNPFPLMAVFGVQIVWNALWSIAVNKLYFMLHKAKKTAIVYKEDSDLVKFNEIDKYRTKFEVVKYIKAPQDLETLKKELDGISAVFVIGIDATLRNRLTEFLIESKITGYFVPHVGDVILAGARNVHLFSIPTMRVSRAELSPEYMLLKRAMDIVVSLTALIVLSPIMLITAIAIKLCDGGPVFYLQERLTQDRKVFRIIKFRSMYVDAEKDGVARLASQSDSRITPVGRIIRACRIDELPQLLNILSGSMTIVGPRPERPSIAEAYEKEMPSFALRLQVKAGLTGYAQVYGRYNTQPYDKLQMDLLYINNMSIIEDIHLMFATVKILFLRESTQGVNADQITAIYDDTGHK